MRVVKLCISFTIFVSISCNLNSLKVYFNGRRFVNNELFIIDYSVIEILDRLTRYTVSLPNYYSRMK